MSAWRFLERIRRRLCKERKSRERRRSRRPCQKRRTDQRRPRQRQPSANHSSAPVHASSHASAHSKAGNNARASDPANKSNYSGHIVNGPPAIGAFSSGDVRERKSPRGARRQYQMGLLTSITKDCHMPARANQRSRCFLPLITLKPS